MGYGSNVLMKFKIPYRMTVIPNQKFKEKSTYDIEYNMTINEPKQPEIKLLKNVN